MIFGRHSLIEDEHLIQQMVSFNIRNMTVQHDNPTDAK